MCSTARVSEHVACRTVTVARLCRKDMIVRVGLRLRAGFIASTR